MVSIIVFGALTKTLLDITLGPQGAPWTQSTWCSGP